MYALLNTIFKNNRLKIIELIVRYLRGSIEQKHIQSVIKANRYQNFEYV
jgi:hypothetical protein